jgi:hypothetical protein
VARFGLPILVVITIALIAYVGLAAWRSFGEDRVEATGAIPRGTDATAQHPARILDGGSAFRISY